MVHGSFDDRNDARLYIKQWLRSHNPDDYTSGNLRRLVNDLTNGDSDPVDHIHITRREHGYGIVKGLVEFAAEDLAVSQGNAADGLDRAYEQLMTAASLLPNRSRAAAAHLQTAVDALSTLAYSSRKTVERSLVAAHLALSLIGAAPAKVAA